MTINKEDMNIILEIQQKAYKDATEILFNALNSRIDDQARLITDLRVSLEFSQSELSDVKNANIDLKKESVDMKMEIEEQRKIIGNLIDRLDSQEDYSRKKNIRIDGVIESNSENNEQTHFKVDQLLKNNLGLENVKIDIAHRIPNKDSSSTSPRTIIARLNRDLDRDSIMKSTRKLKQTGIFINEDFCENTMRVRKELYPKLKAAREANNVAYIKRRSLIIRKKSNQQKSFQSSTSHSPHTPQRQVSSLLVNVTPGTSQPPPSPLLLPHPLSPRDQIKPEKQVAASSSRDSAQGAIRKSQRNK